MLCINENKIQTINDKTTNNIFRIMFIRILNRIYVININIIALFDEYSQSAEQLELHCKYLLKMKINKMDCQIIYSSGLYIYSNIFIVKIRCDYQ